MKGLLFSLLAPRVERILARWEEGTPLQNHLDLVARFSQDLASLPQRAKKQSVPAVQAMGFPVALIIQSCSRQLGVPASICFEDSLQPAPEDLVRMFRGILENPARAETSPEFQALQMLSLVVETTEIEAHGSRIETRLDEAIKGASWKGSPAERSAARVVSTLISCRLKRGFVPAEQAVVWLSRLTGDLPVQAWVSPNGPPYGTSSVLLSFLSLAFPEGPCEIRGYTAQVMERLLRHVEIRRKLALQFPEDNLHRTTSALLERIRFTLAMLKAARLCRDLRYLNAALKLNDWTYREVRMMKVPGSFALSDLVQLNVILHYLGSVSTQEQVREELFHS